jgi:putative heme-binding domain-containing protein
MIGASESNSAIKQLVQKATRSQDESDAGWQAPLLEGLALGLKTKKQPGVIGSDEETMLVKTFFEHPSGKIRNAAFSVIKVTGVKNATLKNKAMQNALSFAQDKNQSADKRVESINFISLGNPPSKAGLMQQLINPGELSSIQLAAVHTLSSIPDTTVSVFLIRQWPKLTPEIQNEAINTFLVNDARIALLLDALQKGIIQTSTIGWNRSVRLMAQKNLPLREKARELLTKNEKDRTKVNAEYQPALSLKGNAEKGKNVYAKNCSVCHQVRGTMGVNFGPDLGTIHNWSAQAIMANILAPDLSISSGYDLWSVDLNNGENFQGIISSETATSITMINAGRETKTINRSDIKNLKALNMSSMPVGLEKQISHQQMADLLAFLRDNK